MKWTITCAALIALAMLTTSSLHAQSPAVPSDADIRQLLADRIDRDRQGVGIVVGVVVGSDATNARSRRVIAYGSLEKDDSRPLTGDTVFEIGSVTKVFTSLLLADMVQRGEVALTDPIAKYLPPDAKVPERNGRAITLLDLATHTSGLPRLPTNMVPKDRGNPYADYSVAQLYQFLSTYSLARDIGSQYEYSNLGGGLLGHVLARRAGMDYEALVRSRITGPLGMTSTSITLSADQQRRLAVGHNDRLASVSNWDLPTLAGGGALRSTANDMLTFVAANLGAIPSPLVSAMSAMLTDRRPTGMPGLDVALAWHVFTRNGDEIIWHNGGTGGYRSFIGFRPRTKVGVVVLSNTFTGAGVDDIGLHVLDAQLPTWQPPKAHTEIAVDANLFEGYVGAYQLAPNFVLTVTREGNRLFVQATGQPKFEVFAEAAKEYFLKAVDAQLSFVTNADGRATAVILHQNGANVTGQRIN
jgi:D-alanyl-D-alanine-carboxypeptidase/D-alanyl-D-alanine-endopeptidase